METDENGHVGRLSALIVKVASRCNLNCSYCYLYNHEDATYRHQPRFMAEEVFAAAMERARDYLERSGTAPPISIILHGGEPTLAGAKRLDAYCRIARATLGERLGTLAMQTNATLLDDEILSVLISHDVAIGISMDGPGPVHNAARVFRNGRTSYEQTLAGIARLKAAGLAPHVLCVVQPGADGGCVYDHFRALGIEHFDFLMPDVSHDNVDRLYGGLGPTPVARYLIGAFDRWIAEDDPAVNIRLFRSLMRALLGAAPENDAFGGALMSYAVIETNGEIEALDALKVCRHGIAKTGLNVRENGFDEIHATETVLARAMFGRIPAAAGCRDCAEFEHCGGGYLPHRYSLASEFDNPSVWCADLKALFGHVRDAMHAYG